MGDDLDVGELAEALVEDFYGAGVALACFSEEGGVYEAHACVDEAGDLLADPGHGDGILKGPEDRSLAAAGSYDDLGYIDVTL